jgi:hypothetical protein
VRKCAFVIADPTPTLIDVLNRHDFHNSWNPKVFVRYRERAAIFIQVFGYDTLVENAKKRNQAFFKVLLDVAVSGTMSVISPGAPSDPSRATCRR